jgi:hypothetical protein
VIGWFHQLEFVMGSCNIKIESLYLLFFSFLSPSLFFFKLAAANMKNLLTMGIHEVG